MKKNNDIVVRFSKRLKEFRKEREMTQEELAEAADISYKNIQYLESTNPTCPSLVTLHKLAKALKVKISKLTDA